MRDPAKQNELDRLEIPQFLRREIAYDRSSVTLQARKDLLTRLARLQLRYSSTTKQQMEKEFGTPEQFAQRCALASQDRLIEAWERERMIADYRQQYEQAPNDVDLRQAESSQPR